MIVSKLKSFLTALFNYLHKLPLKNWLLSYRQKLHHFLASWWQLLLGAFAALVFLYYPVGGWIIEDIDTTTDYEINTAPSQSATVEMMSFLIKREVADKVWTPNLPFIFPSYFLDNMPNFQLGLVSSVSTTADALSAKLDKIVASKQDQPLRTAAELLRYPGTIWMFSPQNKLTPVPSAGSQYKKARKQLIAHNQSLRDGSEVFYKSAADLAYILQKITKDLRRSSSKLDAHIRENSATWIDSRADDLFYYQKGKVYGYALLLNALGSDYKEIIVNADVYQLWTRMSKALEDAAVLNPPLVRNGELDSTSAPNHLAAIGYYTLKAAVTGQDIVNRLNQTLPQGKIRHDN